MLRKLQKTSEANLYVRSLSVHERERVSRSIEAATGLQEDHAVFLTDLMGELTNLQFRLCVQFTPAKLQKLLDGEMIKILQRYESGNNPARMKWRRICNKHGLSTKPAGHSRDKRAYNRDRYIDTKGKGKRMAEITVIVLLVNEIDVELRAHAEEYQHETCMVMSNRLHKLLERLETAVAVTPPVVE